MNVIDTFSKTLNELSEVLLPVDEANVNRLVEEILNASKIYVAGAGRSLLMLRCFAMRLMHLGFEVYVVGDTITPAFESGDLLIVGSGSGETLGSVNVAKKAKTIGGKVALISTRSDSTLAGISDFTIVIPAYTDKVDMPGRKNPTLPGGTLFEHALLVLGDTMVLPLAEAVGVRTDKPFTKHANLE